MERKIALGEKEKKILTEILKQKQLAQVAFVFGSRAKYKNRKYSDVDILLISREAIPQKVIWDLEEEFSESDLPFRIELHQRTSLSNDFYQSIEKDLIPLIEQVNESK